MFFIRTTHINNVRTGNGATQDRKMLYKQIIPKGEETMRITSDNMYVLWSDDLNGEHYVEPYIQSRSFLLARAIITSRPFGRPDGRPEGFVATFQNAYCENAQMSNIFW